MCRETHGSRSAIGCILPSALPCPTSYKTESTVASGDLPSLASRSRAHLSFLWRVCMWKATLFYYFFSFSRCCLAIKLEQKIRANTISRARALPEPLALCTTHLLRFAISFVLLYSSQSSLYFILFFAKSFLPPPHQTYKFAFMPNFRDDLEIKMQKDSKLGVWIVRVGSVCKSMICIHSKLMHAQPGVQLHKLTPT